MIKVLKLFTKTQLIKYYTKKIARKKTEMVVYRHEKKEVSCLIHCDHFTVNKVVFVKIFFPQKHTGLWTVFGGVFYATVLYLVPEYYCKIIDNCELGNVMIFHKMTV